jgi:hypothetical protein
MTDLANKLYDSINLSQGISPNPVSVSYGPGAEHISTKHDVWTVSGWKENEVQLKGDRILDQVEKLQLELANDLMNNKNTTPRPTYFENVDNVITLIGLTESAKRDTGETSTTLTHNSIGTGTTAASESDTDLQTEDTGGSYSRLGYAASGQRKVASQTAKYGMLWDDSKVSAAGVVITESGIHWHVSNSSSIHARVTFTAFTLSAGDLFVTQINELHQNG